MKLNYATNCVTRKMSLTPVQRKQTDMNYPPSKRHLFPHDKQAPVQRPTFTLLFSIRC